MSDNRPDPMEIISYTLRPGTNSGRTLVFPKDFIGSETAWEDGAIYVLRKVSDQEYRLVRMREEP